MGAVESDYQNQQDKINKYDDYASVVKYSNRLNAQAIATVGLWSENHKSKIMLADIPLALYKNNLINTQPLLKLEELYAKLAYTTYYDNVTMYDACMQVAPDILLHHTDEYMAAMISKMSESYDNIFVLCGIGQTRSIPHYLYFSQKSFGLNNVEEVTKYAPTYESIVRKDNSEI